MKFRTLLAVLGAAVIAIVVTSSSTPVAAQAQKAPAKAAAKPAAARPAADKPAMPPRTKDGHPDLSGVYDMATVTPVERPAEAGGRLVLTNEEAAAVAAYERQREAKD